MTKEDVKDLIGGIFGIVFLVGMIFVLVAGIKQCSTNYGVYQQSLPTYHVSYGSFFNGKAGYDFETYKVDGNRYTFYDYQGNVVTDIVVTGNNVIDIWKNPK